MELPGPSADCDVGQGHERRVDRPDGRLTVPSPRRTCGRCVETPRRLDAHRHVPVASEARRAARRAWSRRGVAAVGHAPSAKRQTVPIDAALRAEHGSRPVSAEWARLGRLYPAAPPIRRAASRAGRAEPGRGMGVHDRLGSGARRCRVRRAGTADVATSSDAVAAAVRRATGWVGGRSSPAQQRRLVGALRRRRAHRSRRGAARPSGPPARAIRPRLGRDRQGRPGTGRRCARRAHTRQPAHRSGDPAPRHRPRRARRCEAASRCTATVGPATSSAGPALRRHRS